MSISQPRRADGRYDHQNMDKVCKCGHRLGVHLAEGPRACDAHDHIPDIPICECEKFQWARGQYRARAPNEDG